MHDKFINVFVHLCIGIIIDIDNLQEVFWHTKGDTIPRPLGLRTLLSPPSRLAQQAARRALYTT